MNVFLWLARLPINEIGRGWGWQRLKLWDFQGVFLSVLLCTRFLLTVLSSNLSCSLSISIPFLSQWNEPILQFLVSLHIMFCLIRSVYCTYARHMKSSCLDLQISQLYCASSENSNPEWATSNPKISTLSLICAYWIIEL